MSYTITAVDRSLLLLEAVGENPSSTISELAAITENTKSLVFRILHTLEARGYVVKEPKRRTYTLGYRAISMAHRRHEHFPVLGLAEPVLDSIARQCDENVNLIVRDGMHHLTIASRRSSQPNDLFAQVGRRGPLHVGGGPKILLAFAPPEVREAVLGAPLEAFTEKTVVDRARLGALLDAIAETGLNETRGDHDRDAFSFAAAIRRSDGAVVAALSVAGPLGRLDERNTAAYRGLVRRGAERVSEGLGWRQRLKAVV